ncbi:unnamed protein product [Ixodes persulcatus]
MADKFKRLEQHRLPTLTLRYLAAFEDPSPKLALLNARSLNAHAKDIQRDVILPKANVPSFTETWNAATPYIRGFDAVVCIKKSRAFGGWCCNLREIARDRGGSRTTVNEPISQRRTRCNTTFRWNRRHDNVLGSESLPRQRSKVHRPSHARLRSKVPEQPLRACGRFQRGHHGLRLTRAAYDVSVRSAVHLLRLQATNDLEGNVHRPSLCELQDGSARRTTGSAFHRP